MGGDLHVFGVPAFAELGEDQHAVHAHLETAPGAGDQGEAGDALFVVAQQFFRQTGGFGEIVSGAAVLDADFPGHGDTLLSRGNIGDPEDRRTELGGSKEPVPLLGRLDLELEILDITVPFAPEKLARAVRHAPDKAPLT